MILEIRNYELELVQKRLAKNEIFRPDLVLIMREKILETEMLGDPRVLVLRRDLDESFGILIRLGAEPSPLLGPESYPVSSYRPRNLVSERFHRDQRELADSAGTADRLNLRQVFRGICEVARNDGYLE